LLCPTRPTQYLLSLDGMNFIFSFNKSKQLLLFFISWCPKNLAIACKNCFARVRGLQPLSSSPYSSDTYSCNFYRVMHYSAKRGLAIACRPSVTLVDCHHIGWKSWKLIAHTISPAPSLFVAQRSSTYYQGNMGNFVEVGWEKKTLLSLTSPTL